MEEMPKKQDHLSFEDENSLKESKSTRKSKVFYSELLSNFKSNYERWCEMLKQEQATETSSSL